MNIVDLIKDALDLGASDVHIQDGQFCCLRVNGKLSKVGKDPIYADAIADFCNEFSEILRDSAGNQSWKRDFAFTLHGRRFRANYYRAQKKDCLALRALSARIPTVKQLHLPPEMEMLKNIGKGLTLIVGETGSGKSTTMASLVQHFNETFPYTILTIEDPVEYIYTPGLSHISQREVGDDVESFSQGVKDAMREDPDIIVLGEMRDMDTISNALTLAETGHLVLATLHARNCIEVMDRITDVFPGDSKDTIRSQAANVLQAVVHQTLVASDEYGRLPLLEIMRVDNATRKSLGDPKTGIEQLRQRIRTSRGQGCLHRVDCFSWLMTEFNLDPDLAERILSTDDYSLLIGGK